MKLLVTGGAGFIGSNFIRHHLARRTEDTVLNLDKLTYAGNLENLAGVDGQAGYHFSKGDICDAGALESAIASARPDVIVHFAAESHVDRSILSPQSFFETNLRGTLNLLDAARRLKTSRLVHVSTDEVYGSLTAPLEADEDFPLRPSSPYSSSKAGSDLLALSFFTTYGVPVMVTRASNNYGPYQFPEKFIPLMITNALEGKPLPIYGDGRQVRDWLFVEDHCEALETVIAKGVPGQIYNVGGNCQLENLDVAREILRLTGRPESLLQTVSDRPGHDRRYALSSLKAQRNLGWSPKKSFETGLAETIDWYRRNQSWVSRVKGGDYRLYYEQHYGNRVQTFSGI